MKILVDIKTVYGEERIYPVCPQAHIFAKLTGHKTLTRTHIELIKALGYSVLVRNYLIRGVL